MCKYFRFTAPNTAYTLRVYALALQDIVSFGRNVAYAGNIRRNTVLTKSISHREKNDKR